MYCTNVHMTHILCVPMIPQQLAAGPAYLRAGQLRFGYVSWIAELFGRPSPSLSLRTFLKSESENFGL
jgi:hypothetical protein